MAVQTPAYPSGLDTWVPNHEATAGLVVGYSRNVNEFATNAYTLLCPVEKPLGYFATWSSQEAARVRYSNVRDFIWPSGQVRPTGDNNTESFIYNLYENTRYSFNFTLDRNAVNFSDWNVLMAHSDMAAQQAMTARALLAYSALATLKSGPNTATATTASTNGGASSPGKWNTGTQASPVIMASLNYAAEQINIATIGKVKAKDLVLVITPALAIQMASSAEVHAYIDSSPWALAGLRGDIPATNAGWGLPDVLYGYRVAVEDTVQITSRKGAASVVSGYVIPSSEAYLVSRPGDLMGIAGSPNFSTIQMFTNEEMNVETFDQPRDRLIQGSVTEYYSMVNVSSSSGFAFTACV